MINRETLVEEITSELQNSEYVTTYTVGFDDYRKCAIQIVEVLEILDVLNFTENENGGKKDG